MDWRSWAYARLTEEDNPLLALVPAASIYGAGGLTGSPANKPFIIPKFGTRVRRNPEGPYTETLEVWIHDEPGDYLRIDAILGVVKDRLHGQVALPGAVQCRWEGNSGDLADDGYGTIVKTTSFTLVGTD